MIVPVTIRFEGWLATTLAVPDDLGPDDPFPDDAIEAAISRQGWDDFGVLEIHNVEAA